MLCETDRLAAAGAAVVLVVFVAVGVVDDDDDVAIGLTIGTSFGSSLFVVVVVAGFEFVLLMLLGFESTDFGVTRGDSGAC